MKDQKTIINLINTMFAQYADQVAFIQKKKYRRKIWTYNMFREMISKTSHFLLERNIKKGDRIIICSYNSPMWVCLFFACATKGIVIVPLDYNSTEDFVEQIIKETEPKLFFTSLYKKTLDTKDAVQVVYLENIENEIQQFEPIQNESADKVLEDDLLEIVFTSGSTGHPKGVMVTNKNLYSNICSLLEIGTLPKNSKLLSIIPLSHMFEQSLGLLDPLVLGVPIVYLPAIKPVEIIKAFREENINSAVCVPAFLKLFEDHIRRQAEGN